MDGSDDWRARLEAVRGRSNCEIVTRGRRTGKPHPVTVWFAVGDDGTVWLSTLRMDRDWPKNLARNPALEVRMGDLRLRGEGRVVEDEAKRARIESALRSKYLAARIGSWFGLRPAATFEVRILGEAA